MVAVSVHMISFVMSHCIMKSWNHYRPHPKDGEGNVFSLFTPGGVYPYPIMLCNITQNSMGQTPRGGTLPGPAEGGGYPAQGGTLPRWEGTLLGGTQLGQQKEYSLHGAWYASCIHAGGLSCFIWELGNRCHAGLLYYSWAHPSSLHTKSFCK